ncbi:hypothetical protein DPX16_5596 [Anabarilius grahami]|uniref:Uncharacterized protein n=1 Tax=Anabarilius grahami TaxID=495550 RepID=A0A3N0Y9W1_ANAGA|nr:hypothetical protein DPX16_5596 [Anabarilius grahami]
MPAWTKALCRNKKQNRKSPALHWMVPHTTPPCAAASPQTPALHKTANDPGIGDPSFDSEFGPGVEWPHMPLQRSVPLLDAQRLMPAFHDGSTGSISLRSSRFRDGLPEAAAGRDKVTFSPAHCSNAGTGVSLRSG